MTLILELISISNSGSRHVVGYGNSATIGRASDADFCFAWDQFLSGQHCGIEWDEDRPILCDRNSRNGTFVNGTPITRAELKTGDVISVGSIRFVANFANSEKHADGAPCRVAGDEVPFLNYFRAQKLPLFALVDAACDLKIGEQLRSLKERSQCLYEGDSAVQYADYAPYLLQFAPQSQMLEWLLGNGWGRGWASFFISNSSFEDLHLHFRKFLLAKLDNGREVLFRFYDPRVFRDFLPTCNAKELNSFFASVASWMVESGNPAILRHFQHRDGLLLSSYSAQSEKHSG